MHIPDDRKQSWVEGDYKTNPKSLSEDSFREASSHATPNPNPSIACCAMLCACSYPPNRRTEHNTNAKPHLPLRYADRVAGDGVVYR